MSARTIRRSFAAPFVVTIATMSPALADKPPPSPPGKNPPAPREPAKAERHWTGQKSGAKDAKPTDCFAQQEFTCPKAAPGKPQVPCNPPEPMPYTCPPNFDAKSTAAYKIILRVGATECFQDVDTKCPPGTKCNP